MSLYLVSEYAPLLLLAALLLIFWLVVMRPARRQQSTVADIQRNLAVGDRVVLSAGIFGTIAGLDEGRVRLEIAPGTVIEVARQVVVRRADDVPATPPDGAVDEPETSVEQRPTDPTTDRPDAG